MNRTYYIVLDFILDRYYHSFQTLRKDSLENYYNRSKKKTNNPLMSPWHWNSSDFRLSRHQTYTGTDIITHIQCSRPINRSRFWAHCQTAHCFSSSVMAPCSPHLRPSTAVKSSTDITNFLDCISETVVVESQQSLHIRHILSTLLFLFIGILKPSMALPEEWKAILSFVMLQMYRSDNDKSGPLSFTQSDTDTLGRKCELLLPHLLCICLFACCLSIRSTQTHKALGGLLAAHSDN